MGLILDTSVVIAAERQGLQGYEMLEQVQLAHGESQLALCSMTIMELTHALERTIEPRRRIRRNEFLQVLISGVEIYPVTTAVAWRAGLIEGNLAARGITIGVADLLIGSTALELGYSVLTGNLRHFHAIPGLIVVSAA